MNHRVIRNNEVVHENTVQYFDFEQSGAYLVPQDSYVLEPGDSMETECFYKDSTNGNVNFGLSSSDEMCITFLWYFPKRNLEFCGFNIFFDNDCLGSYNRETLDDEGEIGRTFGIERQVTTSPTSDPSGDMPSSLSFCAFSNMFHNAVLSMILTFCILFYYG